MGEVDRHYFATDRKSNNGDFSIDEKARPSRSFVHEDAAIRTVVDKNPHISLIANYLVEENVGTPKLTVSTGNDYVNLSSTSGFLTSWPIAH